MTGWLNYEAWVRDYAPHEAVTAMGQNPGTPAPDLGASEHMRRPTITP
jgi:hypothetical protein